MSLGARVRGLLGGAPKIKVRVFVHGRIGEGWRKVDRTLALPEGATLEQLVARADSLGLDLSGAIAASPHLEHTLMLNGERCPLKDNLQREMQNGDEVFLLAPIAGG